MASTESRLSDALVEGVRVPPQALDAERSVLGAMLLDPKATSRVLEILDESVFYRPAHRRIFSAVVAIWERKEEAIDAVAVTDELRKQGSLDSAGGVTYLAALIDSVATSANVEFHAQIVKEKAILRKLIEIASDVAGRAYGGAVGAADLLDEAEQAIFSVSDERARRGFIRVEELIHPTIKRIEQLYEDKQPVTGVATGFLDLDHLTSGMQKGDLLVVAGRPSMGKTSLAMNVAANVAIRGGKGVGIFSLEMSTEQLIMRLLCSEARVSAHRLRTGYLRDKEWPLLITAADRKSVV